ILRASYEQLTAALAHEHGIDPSFLAPARELGRLLVQEACEGLEDKQHLIIVPDGFLGLLPFEALLMKDVTPQGPVDFARLPYLPREKPVTYAPSASFLADLSEHQAKRRTWRKDALLIGDALYFKETSVVLGRRSLPSFDPSSFKRLARTREEVIAIAEGLV